MFEIPGINSTTVQYTRQNNSLQNNKKADNNYATVPSELTKVSANNLRAYIPSFTAKANKNTEVTKQTQIKAIKAQLDDEGKILFKNLQAAGILENNDSNDGSSVMDNLYKIATEPRFTGLSSEQIIKDVLSCQSTGQPVLIGTLSIQESDEICKRLEEYGIRFQRLDAISAKDMKNEAAIVSTAGLFGSVTVATNMAGRGTDIKLGPGVKEVGGLYVIGTSKNKNSRIDNQLRGRAGRQGDPGRCKYFSSLDDELVQTRNNSNKFIFFKKKYKNIKEKLNNKKLIKLVSLCQKVEESIAKLSRKSNENRELISFTPYKKIVYEQRAKVLKSSGDDYLKYLDQIVDSYTKKVFAQKSDYEYISQKFQGIVDIEKDAYQKVLAKSGKDINVVFSAAIKRRIHSSLVTSDAKKNFCEKNKIKTLKCIDDNWVSYIYSLEEYNKGSYLLQYGANYSKDTYKMDTHMMYDNMIENMQNEIIAYAVNSKLEYGKYKVAISENNMGAIL